MSFGNEGVEQFEKGLGFAGNGFIAHEPRMAANLAQARKSGEDMDFALGQAFFGNGLHHLLAAAAQLSQVEFALLGIQLAIATLLDALGQVFRHVPLEPAQEQGP